VGHEGDTDPRHIYIEKLLSLALNKTKYEYGDFTLQKTNQNENPARLLKQLDNNVYENFFFSASMNDEVLDKYQIIEFPVYRGAAGYRVAFTNNNMPCKLLTFEKIKQSLHIQGVGWLDYKILKNNNFDVEAVSHYEQMFNMVIYNRVDYFFRGINEIALEWSVFPNLKLESCFALHYPLPKFFITHKNNKQNAKRINIGLLRAYQDGSFLKLWQSFFLESMKQINLKNRKIFELENPFITTLNDDYLKYNFSLNELK
jgi:hypothetical protein